MEVLKRRVSNVRKALGRLCAFTRKVSQATGGGFMPPEKPPKAPFVLTETVRQFGELIRMKVVGLSSVGDSDAAGAGGINELGLAPVVVAMQRKKSTSANCTQSTSVLSIHLEWMELYTIDSRLTNEATSTSNILRAPKRMTSHRKQVRITLKVMIQKTQLGRTVKTSFEFKP